MWNATQLSYEQIKDIAQRYDERIVEWVKAAYHNTDISMLDLDETDTIGYTLRALSAALWCYWHARSFKDGLQAVVNEGGDADTNAAVSCSILGAKFGVEGIPGYYIKNLHNREVYLDKCEGFIEKICS